MARLAGSKAAFGTVLVGGVVFFLCILAFLEQLLGAVSVQADAIDARRTFETVGAAIAATEDKLAYLAADNAYWDDAVHHAGAAVPDTDWLYATWGAVAGPEGGYDAVYVVDEAGRVAWGHTGGRAVTGAGAELLGTTLAAMATRRAAVTADDGAERGAAFVAMPDGLAVAAAARIRPSTEREIESAGGGRALVFVRHVDAALLGELATTFLIDDLRVATPADRGDRLALRGPSGEVVASVTWARRNPGREATDAAWPHVRNTLVLVTVSIALFVAIAGYGLQRLSREEQKARRAALTDGLSGLPNRRAVTEHLEEVLSRPPGEDAQAVIVFVDLDGFKDVNDTYGHGTGDVLIRMVSTGLGMLRGDGMLARLGGDEFAAVFASRMARREAVEFASDVLLLLGQPLTIGERRIQIGASIGIAVGNPGECDGTELFRRADVAMYEAKLKGGNRMAQFEAEFDHERNMRQTIEEGIRGGLDRGEFAVHYQPIVEAATGRVGAVEALVRWPGREEGQLGPDVFIAVAESSGLIHQLGLFVLRRACEDLRDLHDLSVSVNVSPAQFRDPNFEYNVAEVLAEVDFPPSRLELEVTEGYLIEHPDRAVAAIAALKRQGISITLDDFGTGYSSIGYLRRYGFDRIKIDKSLAGRVGADPQATALVSGTVAIANALAMAVTAEGVETADHALLLRAAGCQKLQGYHFGRPVPLADLRRALSNVDRPAAAASADRAA
ncbi:putative bifunctional diguanylate cyclase/phosphodiesterase [Oharaeibacter diazotrophicus]|uniref:Diguanylate cyclase (GGDEF)-like protein n=1 Tax=Oharaeibacter diazotrophicus TaxID=1920512 RepID=A0A4R6RCK8_9HYPH|nr:EAL domain-containing protein [Oharaeibacter diazotrophicus]TDP83893.1 diguanylate cyclase (GGDEF)-like protein [Oharaeibacter diazotrophicus]BBE72935.1 cyclic di-GMP phosphodiesterase Gmr [Pleomorphomonas sp. SM30]GLS74714.1 bifunctional diguanylate cyclase/phosphodiesterase [Oharaeibacter diazotrophicus]